MSVYVATMLKGLGVAFISEICAGICRDFGKNTLADGVDLAGKLEIILLCVPMKIGRASCRERVLIPV